MKVLTQKVANANKISSGSDKDKFCSYSRQIKNLSALADDFSERVISKFCKFR